MHLINTNIDIKNYYKEIDLAINEIELIELFEYEKFPIDNKILGNISNEFFNFEYKDNQFLLKAKQYVGVYQNENYRISVYPKICYHPNQVLNEKTKKEAMLNFLFMFSYVSKFDIKDFDTSSDHHKDYDFLEVLIWIFARRLFDLLKSNLHRAYVPVEDETNFLKGTWRLSEQLSKAPHIKHKFHVTYDEFTENNELNRVFKFVCNLLLKYSKNGKTHTLLHQILNIFCEVDDIHKPSREYLAKVKFTRQNRIFERIFEYAKMFIFDLISDHSTAKHNSFSFMFDMNMLFEKFIFEFIKQENVLSGTDYESYTLQAQGPQERLLQEIKDGKKLEKSFKMKPDITISNGNDRKCIIDTKYKKLNKEKDKENFGISNADVYQMHAYSSKYNCPKVIMLYPQHIEDIKKDFIFEDNKFLHIRSINIQQNLKGEKAKLKKDLTAIINNEKGESNGK